MLEVSNLHAFYGKSHILQGVNFELGEGGVMRDDVMDRPDDAPAFAFEGGEVFQEGRDVAPGLPL